MGVRYPGGIVPVGKTAQTGSHLEYLEGGMVEEHDLGDCEQWWGYTCEECRLEYQTRWQDYEQQDRLDEKYYDQRFFEK